MKAPELHLKLPTCENRYSKLSENRTTGNSSLIVEARFRTIGQLIKMITASKWCEG